MKNNYRSLRIGLFAILTIIYYILAVFIKQDNLRWLEYGALLASLALGLAILFLDVKRLETSKRKVLSFILLLALAVSLQFAIEHSIYNFSLTFKILAVLAFIVVYAAFLNYDFFKVEYKI